MKRILPLILACSIASTALAADDNYSAPASNNPDQSQAQDQSQMQAPNQPDENVALQNQLSKIHAEANLGWSATHFHGLNNNGLFGGGVSAGYDLLPNLAFDVGYLGQKDATNREGGVISESAINMLLVGSTHLVDHFSVFFKMGSSYMLATFKQPAIDTQKMHQWVFSYGMGLTYDFTGHFYGNFQWFHTQGKAGSFANGRGIPKSDFYGLGLGARL
tara:strand:+ start:24124 stop:24777 length:654 start_codon:yes stop_codon:yes gene_type:complete